MRRSTSLLTAWVSAPSSPCRSLTASRTPATAARRTSSGLSSYNWSAPVETETTGVRLFSFSPSSRDLVQVVVLRPVPKPGSSFNRILRRQRIFHRHPAVFSKRCAFHLEENKNGRPLLRRRPSRTNPLVYELQRQRRYGRLAGEDRFATLGLAGFGEVECSVDTPQSAHAQRDVRFLHAHARHGEWADEIEQHTGEVRHQPEDRDKHVLEPVEAM